MPVDGYFDTVFATAGDVTPVPDPTQPGGTVSYEQGFPVGYSTPVLSGGFNVPRGSFNQLFKDITTALQNWQQNTIAPFITSTMNGGTPYSYSKYNMVLESGVAYMSLADSNTDTPPSVKWMALDFRQKLTGNKTYYVATTGSNSNDGSSGSPWLTIQYAFNWVKANVDTGGHTVTISVADGTYAENVTVSGGFPGGGTVLLQGNTTTPANCIISPASGDALVIQNGRLSIAGFRLTSATSNAINAGPGGVCSIDGNMNFGTVAALANHLYAAFGGQIIVNSNYTIAGNGLCHANAYVGGIIQMENRTYTLSGTPAFSEAFAKAANNGTIEVYAASFSGSATGPRYAVSLNGVIDTAGGGATYLPGSTSGSAATGGQYA